MPRPVTHLPKRVNSVSLKLDDLEKALLVRAAEATATPPSAWARDALMRAVRETVGEILVGEVHPPMAHSHKLHP